MLAEAPAYRSREEIFAETRPVSRLESELEYYRNNWMDAGLPQNWANLPGIGFLIEPQMDLYDGLSSSRWVAVTEEDVRGYVLEYPEQGLTFPIFNQVQNVDGKDRIFSNRYGKLWVETISDAERNGSVRRVFEDIVEPYLLGEDGRIAVVSSPQGWSGLTDNDGNPIVYPDSQTYILQRQGNEIVGFTVRTDFSYEEHQAFIKALSGKSLDGSATIVDYVESPILLEASEGVTIPNVVSAMAQVRKNFSGSEFVYKDREWGEVFDDLTKREDLWKLDPASRSFYKDLSDFVLYASPTREQVQQALALTILKLDKHVSNKNRKERNAHDASPTLEDLRPYNMGDVYKEAQSRGGCAGGGSKSNKLIINSITPRVGISLSGEEEDSEECKSCGRSTEDKHYHCPSCGHDYKNETDKDPSQRTKICKGTVENPQCKFKFAC